MPLFSHHTLTVRSLKHHLCSAARWLAALALVFHVAWLPVHLLTTAHCDTSPAHAHAQAHADHHGHSHDDAEASHSHGDTDHHHFTGDHESKFLSKRQAIFFAPVLAAWLTTELDVPLMTVARAIPRAEFAPPPADFSPPTGPRAPPLA